MDIAVEYSRGETEATSGRWQQEDCLMNICNKTILSNDNNNNSWTVKSIIVEMIRQPARGEEGGERRGGAYYTVHITLHYALRRPNASNVFCSAELPAWDPWQGVPCIASWAI